MKHSLIAGVAVLTLLFASVEVAHAEPDEPRSAAMATWLSFGGIAASGLTIAAGAAVGGDTGGTLAIIGATSLLITPSFGQLYSGKFLSTGLVTRAAGTAAMGAGAALLIHSFDLFSDNGNDAEASAGMLVFFGGGLAFATGAILDLVSAGTAAEAWNAKHGFTLAPAAISTPTGTSAGLGLSGRF